MGGQNVCMLPGEKNSATYDGYGRVDSCLYRWSLRPHQLICVTSETAASTSMYAFFGGACPASNASALGILASEISEVTHISWCY